MTQHRINYFRLVALIIDVANLVILKYIKEKLLGSDSFESFLNKQKHKLIHIYKTSPCCECGIPSTKGKTLLSKKQFSILYNSDKENRISNHIKHAGNKLTQICICEYSAKEDIDVEVLDITLANYIIQICGKHEKGISSWIEQIKKVRNEIFHLSDIHKMKNDRFDRKWTTLEGSIIGIAQTIKDSTYAAETIERITQTKKVTIIYDYMLKFEKICREEWKNKCAEFKSEQMQIIKEESALPYTIPQLFSRSMGKDCQKTMKQMGNLMIDKINVMIKKYDNHENVEKFEHREAIEEDMHRIRIPVCMQLDIPTSWDKTKVYEALDEARLNGTSEKSIRIKAISFEDLNIFADISNKLRRNVDVFCSEINTMVSTILSGADIDTTEDAQLCVNLEVQDVSGVPNADNIIEPKEEIGTPPVSSVYQQCSTTEPVDNSNAVKISETNEEMVVLPDNYAIPHSSTTESDDNPNAVNMSERKEEIKIGELPDNIVIQQCSTTDPDDYSNAVHISETKEEIGELPDNSVNQQCSTTEPAGVSNAETTIETKEELGKSPDSTINQEFSTTEPDENEPNKEVQDQTSVKTNLLVSVTLRQQLNIKKSKIYNNPMINSCIKTGNTLVFTDYTNNQLIICNSDGTNIDYKPLSYTPWDPYTPWYITQIDSNTVAVSCRDNKPIRIINISTRSVTSTINTSGDCYGISYNDDNLYVVIDYSIIHVMDLTGKVTRTIPVPTGGIWDITVDRDRLVCIDKTSIYCCSLAGKVMWKFKNDKFQDLTCVQTDGEGNVYVTNEETHTVIVVSDDGKHYRELLTELDGLDRPYGIYFDKKENILLVCNKSNGNAFMFAEKNQ